MESRNPLQDEKAADAKRAQEKLAATDGDETQLTQKEADATRDQAVPGAGGIEVPAHRADAGTVAAAREEAERTGQPVTAPQGTAENRATETGTVGSTGKAARTADRAVEEAVDPAEKKDPFKETPGGPTSIAPNKSQPGGIGKSEARRQRQFNER
jgi:hypothetical protein